jgi:co-chaperonin GroES (HSP10)
MKPTRDLVLVEADAVKDRTESGLFIQEDWKTLPPTGVVISIGDAVTEVKPGDRVVFERYGSVTYNKTQKLCKESQILGVING